MVSTTLYSDVAIRGIVEMSNGTSIGVVDTMPSASAKLSGASVLYMGTDGTNYHTNTVYECTGSGSSWTWTAKAKLLDPDISVATQGQIDTLTSTVNSKLGKTEKASSAGTADKATGDGAGNNIANTYATKNELTTGLAGKLSTTGKAKSAETADSATKATQDGSGNIISSTYLTTSSAESTYAKKAEIASALKYMGSKAKYSDLPSTGNTKGDVWNVVAANGNTPAGTNYAWDGSAWDPLGGTVDLSSYQTKKVETASRALITNGDGNIAVSDVTSTELGYLDGVTSAIQTQINAVKTTADGAIQQGGTLSKPLKVTGGDQATAGKIMLDQAHQGQITDTSTATLLGFTGADTLAVGSSSYNTALRGKQARPTWNGNDLALKSDVPTSYVPSTRTVNGKALSSNITLTASDVGALASNGTAAKATADADGNNIASTYATKSDVTAIPKFNVAVMTALPSSNISTSTIYLIKDTNSGTNNVYTEYLYVLNKWEIIGTTMTDLTNYSKKADTIKALSISGKTITYTKGDGTFDTLTTEDNRVNQVRSTSTSACPVLINGNGNSNVNGQVYYNSAVTVQPSTGTLTATKFKGALEGEATSATSATKATQDADGNTISSTYLKKTDAASTYAKAISKSSVSISASGWSSNTTMSGFKYRASIAISGCTADHVPVVTFDNTQAVSGNYCPVAETYAGGVYIWSKVNTAITVPSVIVVKP